MTRRLTMLAAWVVVCAAMSAAGVGAAGRELESPDVVEIQEAARTRQAKRPSRNSGPGALAVPAADGADPFLCGFRRFSNRHTVGHNP